MSATDILKWLLATSLLVAGVVGFYWFETESLLIRSISLTITLAVVAGISFTTVSGKLFIVLFNSARGELRRVVWPTRPETTQTTILVLVFTLIVGIILFLLDTILSWLFSFFIIT